MRFTINDAQDIREEAVRDILEERGHTLVKSGEGAEVCLHFSRTDAPGYRAVKDGGLLPIWQAAAQGSGLTGYNWFVRENQKCFTKKGMVGDFEKVALTVGELALPDGLRLAPAEEGWELTWKNESVFPPCDGSDRLAVALMKDERSFVVKVPDIGEWQRKHCRALIRLPTELEEYKHLFVFFCSADGKAVSRSKYFVLY